MRGYVTMEMELEEQQKKSQEQQKKSPMALDWAKLFRKENEAQPAEMALDWAKLFRKENGAQPAEMALDWAKLFRKENGAQPAEIVVVVAQDEEQKKQQVEMEGFTDHQLREKVKRLRAQINSPYLKLPDNRAKLRLILKLNEEEIARREQIQRQKKQLVKMEVEEPQQLETLLKPNWAMLFGKENEAQPAEIVPAQDEEPKKQQVEMEAFTDHQLKEKVKRFRSQINSPYLKLPDNGARLRLGLKLAEKELARRDQIRSQKKQLVEMEVEEPQQLETLLKPNWAMLFGKENEAKPAEIVPAQDEEPKKQQVEMEAFTDHQLKEKVKRFRSQINSPYLKLPDNGTRLRLDLKLAEEELARRDQIRSQKAGPQEAECENLKQSQSSCSPGACNEFSSEASSSQALSRPKSTSQKLGKELDPSTQILVNPFHKELPSVGCGNHPNTKINGLLLSKGRRGTSTRWRNPRFRFSKVFSCDGDEQRAPIGGQNDIGSSRFCPPRLKGRFSNRLFRRPRRAEMIIPNLHSLQIQSILQSILQSSSTSGSQSQSPITYQVNVGGPSEAQMAELLSSIHVMQEEFQTVQIKLASLETKVEQIIRIQSGDKSTKASTPEEHCADS